MNLSNPNCERLEQLAVAIIRDVRVRDGSNLKDIPDSEVAAVMARIACHIAYSTGAIQFSDEYVETVTGSMLREISLRT